MNTRPPLTHIVLDALGVLVAAPVTVDSSPLMVAAVAEALANGDLEERAGGFLVRPSTERLLGELAMPVIARLAPEHKAASAASPLLDGAGFCDTLAEIAEYAENALILTASRRAWEEAPVNQKWRWLCVSPLSFDEKYLRMARQRMAGKRRLR